MQRQSFGRRQQALPSPLTSRSCSPSTSPSTSPPPRRSSLQTLEKKLRSSFSDRAASISMALEESGSGVIPRRKPKTTRTTRKAGVWNSVADLINTMTHQKPDAAAGTKSPKSPRNLSPSRMRRSWSGASWSAGSPKRTPSPSPKTAVRARRSYSDPSDLYGVGPEEQRSPDGGQPTASPRFTMLSLRRSSRT